LIDMRTKAGFVVRPIDLIAEFAAASFDSAR